MLRLLTVAAVFGLLAGWSPSTRAQDVKPDGIDAQTLETQTEWYGLYLNSKKIGYCRAARDRVDGNVRDSFTLVMKLVSFGQKAELTLNQSMVFEAKAPFRLLRGDFHQDDGRAPVKIGLERKGEGFEIRHEAGGEIKLKMHGPIDYNFIDATVTERWIRTGPKEGAKVASKDFNIQDLKLEPQSSTVKSVKTSLVGGVQVKYHEVETASKQLTMLARYDDQGRMLSGKFFVFDIRRETEAQAKNTEFSQDLFVLGMVKVDRPLGNTKNVRQLIVDVAGLESAIFEDGPRQSFSPGEAKGTGTLRVGKKHGKEAKVSAKEIEEHLEETLAYPLTHPKVKALADKAVGDATTSEEKVKRIVEFVHDYVEPNLSATLPNVHDLMKNKKGDCKSYALLTAVLARASGVPAREVSGLLYIGDDNKAFGGHAWNEVVLNGVWVPIDASMGETEVNATHISFGTQDRAAKGLLESLGKLSFKLVEVRTGN